VSFLSIILMAGAVALPAASTGPAAARSAVRRADTERCAAMDARDVDRFLSLVADDVAVFPEQQPLVKWKVAVDIGNGSPPPERDFGPPPVP